MEMHNDKNKKMFRRTSLVFASWWWSEVVVVVVVVVAKVVVVFLLVWFEIWDFLSQISSFLWWTFSVIKGHNIFLDSLLYEKTTNNYLLWTFFFCTLLLMAYIMYHLGGAHVSKHVLSLSLSHTHTHIRTHARAHVLPARSNHVYSNFYCVVKT